MPAFVKTKSDEKKWSEAKKAADQSSSDKKWALVNYIYQRKKGKKQ